MRPPFSDVAFRWFSDWLIEQYGLYFGPEKRDILRARLEPRRAALGFDSFEQLFLHLKYHPDRERERSELIPHLTNKESYFFREPEKLRLFSEEILPLTHARLEKRGRMELRILSAGCAAGEEPYTLSILIEKSGLFPPPWKVRLIGIDLDETALERARLGSYGQNAFRNLDPALRNEYFSQQPDESFLIRKEIRRSVRFEQANLLDAGWPAQVGIQDIIFCRNVLIYFNDSAIERVIRHFYGALEPGGTLFLGHADSLSRITTRFVPIRRPGAICYQRPEVVR